MLCYFEIQSCMAKLQPGYDSSYLTLTLAIGMRVVNATHRLYMMNLCAMLFWNPIMHGEVKARTWNKLWPSSVTLTFGVGTQVMNATHRLYMMNICAKLFWNPIMHGKVTARTRNPITARTWNKLWPSSVTLTFGVGTQVMNATHRLYMMNICAKLFWNPIMHGKVTARTRNPDRRTDRQTNGQTDVLTYGY